MYMGCCFIPAICIVSSLSAIFLYSFIGAVSSKMARPPTALACRLPVVSLLGEVGGPGPPECPGPHFPGSGCYKHGLQLEGLASQEQLYFYTCLLHCRQMPCLLISLHGPQVVPDRYSGPPVQQQWETLAET